MPTNRLVEKGQVAAYTEALFAAAEGAGGQDAHLAVRGQLRSALDSLRKSAELRGTLKDSSLAPEQRAQVARGMFAPGEPAVAEVLAVMAERGDIRLLSRVADAYDALLAEKLNLCVVNVTTAVSLDDHLRTVITKKAASDLGMNVVLEERVDPSILGGIIMSANGERIDASMLTQIENARTVLRQS